MTQMKRSVALPLWIDGLLLCVALVPWLIPYRYHDVYSRLYEWIPFMDLVFLVAAFLFAAAIHYRVLVWMTSSARLWPKIAVAVTLVLALGTSAYVALIDILDTLGSESRVLRRVVPVGIVVLCIYTGVRMATGKGIGPRAVSIAIPPLVAILMCVMWGAPALTPINALLIMGFTTPIHRGYAWPSSPVALMLFYFVLALDLVALGLVLAAVILSTLLYSGLYPAYRRSRSYWWPTHLPAYRSSPKGMTLIELLIVIAILTILFIPIANMSGHARRTLEHQADWRAAIELAEDEIALLRARDSLPELGRHPVADELHDLYPFAEQAEVDIREGPNDAVREVRVTVHLNDDAFKRDVSLTALLRATAVEPGE